MVPVYEEMFPHTGFAQDIVSMILVEIPSRHEKLRN